jgi:hypothetical protein
MKSFEMFRENEEVLRICVQQAASLLSLGDEVDTQVVVIATLQAGSLQYSFRQSWMNGSTASSMALGGSATVFIWKAMRSARTKLTIEQSATLITLAPEIFR